MPKIEKITITHLSGCIEIYDNKSFPNLIGGITAIGYQIEPQEGFVIIIHPSQVQRIVIEYEKETNA